jgi:hypothetical protein
MLAVLNPPRCASDREFETWFSPARFSLLLAALVLALFPEVILGGRTFIFRDFGMFGYPLAHYFRESFWRGEIPLWNPLNHCGMPFLAQWNTLVLYPGSLIYLLLPLDWSLGAFNLLHLFLCGVAMYCLAWYWVRNRLAATVAGLAFAFNGFTLNCMMWPNYIASLAWMPLVVLTVQQAYCHGGGRKIAQAAITGAMQMLSGTPEIILLTWVVLAGLFIIDIRGPNRLRSGSAMITVVLLVACLAAAQLLPFLDLIRNAQRESGLPSDTWSMPLTGWANFLVPLFHTLRTPSGVYFQEGQDVTSSYYLGIGPLAIAVIACSLVRNKRVHLLAGVTAVCLVLAFGPAGGLYTVLLKAFPPLGFMRFPVKFVMLAVFSVPLLTAFGIQSYFDCKVKAGFWRVGLIVITCLLVSTAALVCYDLLRPAADEVSSVTARNGLLRIVFLSGILGCFFALENAAAKRLKWLSGLGLMVLLWMDVATHMPRQNPTVEPGVFESGLPPLKELNPRPVLGESRAMLSLDAILSLRTRMPTNTATGYLLYRLALYNNVNLLDDLPKVDGFFALRLRDEESVRFRLYPTPDSYSSPLADFLSVSQVTSPTNLFQWTPRSSFLPMITVGQAPVFLDSTQTLVALTQSDFNPRTTVFLPTEDQPRVSVRRQTTARVLRSKWTAHEITAEVEAAAPALAVVSQAFSHNWRAYIDGKPTPVLRANCAFQALEVPAGTHHLQMRYEDNMFRIGLVLSLMGIVACAVLWMRGPRTSVEPCSPQPNAETPSSLDR